MPHRGKAYFGSMGSATTSTGAGRNGRTKYTPHRSLLVRVARYATRSESARRAGGGEAQQTRVWGADQAVDRRQALRMVTIDAAFFIGEEKMLGSIEPGKFADLVVLNGDYMAVPDDRIDELEAAITIVGGKIVYETRKQ